MPPKAATSCHGTSLRDDLRDQNAEHREEGDEEAERRDLAGGLVLGPQPPVVPRSRLSGTCTNSRNRVTRSPATVVA